MQNNTLPLGHNQPPSDAQILQERLQDKHAKILDHATKLCDASERAPQEIDSDEEAGKAGDLIKMIGASTKNLEAERVNEKEPFLSQGRLVDGFFKHTTDKLAAAKRRVQAPLDAWLRKKEAEERRRREEEAARLRRESEDKAAAAALLEQAKLLPQAENMLDEAAIIAASAAKAEQKAEAKPADMARTRSAQGALASLRTRWVGELVDAQSLDLERLRHHLNPEALQKAVNSYVSAGGRELRGAKIYEKSETIVR